ncbi:hypothetical protein BJ912DRAFT_985864, partial [Pholiota molesta]
MHISHGSSEVNLESTGTHNGIVLTSTSGTPRSTHNVPTARAPHIHVSAGGSSTRATVVEITDEEEEDDTGRAYSGASGERCVWEADGSDAPEAADSNRQEELEPHGRKDAGKKKKAAAHKEEQPRVVDVSDEDEDGAWVDVQDGAAEGEAGDGEEGAGSARTHGPADAFPARPRLVHASTAYLDGPAVPILDVYGNVRGYRYPTRAAQARVAAGQGTAGGGGHAHFHGTPYLGSPGYVEYSAYSLTPAGGFNQVFSSVNNGSNNVSAVSISNCGNNDSVIHYEQ